MVKLRWTESMNIDVRIFFSDVMQKIDVPFERQFRMIPALHQDLHAAGGSEFIQLLVELFEAENVMILIVLCPIKRAELAVNVAHVCVINVAIDDVGHDLAAVTTVAFRLRQITPRIRKS